MTKEQDLEVNPIKLLIDKNLVQTEFPLKSKADVAQDIMNELLKQINA